MKKRVHIDRWAIGVRGGRFVLFGVPTDHPGSLVSNQRLVITSPIVEVRAEDNIVETQNTQYILGPNRLDPDRLDDVVAPYGAGMVRECLGHCA